jgi:hypothetical protein
MSDQQVTAGQHFTLDLGGAQNGLLFKSASMPTGSFPPSAFMTADAKGIPVNTLGGGVKVQWSALTLLRGVDTDKALYEWFDQIRTKGICKETKKDIKITALDTQNQPLKVWNITGAYLTEYGMSGVDAESGAILTEQVSITFEDATLES